MDASGLFGATFSITAIAFGVISIWARSRKGTKRVMVLEFQRGVKFKNGAFEGILEPGNYRIHAKKEQITVVDMRPQPIVLEQCSFQDAHQQAGYISLSAELAVVDPRTVTKESKNHVNDAVLAIREVIRRVGSRYEGATLKLKRADIERELLETCRKDLAKLGLTLKQLTITDSSGAGSQRTAGFVGVSS